MPFVTNNIKSDVSLMLQGVGGVFECDTLAVVYETDPAALQKILPPGLKLRGKPFVQLIMNNFTKTDFCAPYQEGVIHIAVTDVRNNMAGAYPVSLVLNDKSGDIGAFGGREFGFPKKLGHITAEHSGHNYAASISRHGVRFANFSCDTSRKPNDPQFEGAMAQFGAPASKSNPAAAAFNYLWPMALRKQIKPKLLPCYMRLAESNKVEVGFAEATLEWSEHDPWASIPIKKILGGAINTGMMDLKPSKEDEWADIDPEAYLPFSYVAWDLPPKDAAKLFEEA